MDFKTNRKNPKKISRDMETQEYAFTGDYPEIHNKWGVWLVCTIAAEARGKLGRKTKFYGFCRKHRYARGWRVGFQFEKKNAERFIPFFRHFEDCCSVNQIKFAQTKTIDISKA